jgi:carbonic anhydrase/acetyltransferase-like protein (isoleucine patch superfamily)
VAFLDTIARKIRRRETPVYDMAYRFAKGVNAFNVPDTPTLRRVAKAAYAGQVLVRETAERARGVFWAEPLFRSRCESAGKALYVEHVPYIIGDTKIYLGDHVTISGHLSIKSGRFFDDPELRIGSHTFIGNNSRFTVNRRVVIGEHCNIAGGTTIADSDGHPSQWQRRADNDAIGEEEVGEVIIGDHVWIGRDAQILKGVKIGDRAIIGAGSVVINDVPEDMIAMGSPARLVRGKS